MSMTPPSKRPRKLKQCAPELSISERQWPVTLVTGTAKGQNSWCHQFASWLVYSAC
jgi:hypothetical protein